MDTLLISIAFELVQKGLHLLFAVSLSSVMFLKSEVQIPKPPYVVQWEKERAGGNKFEYGVCVKIGELLNLLFFFLCLFPCYYSLAGNSQREKCSSIMASLHFYFLGHNSYFMTLLDALILSDLNFWLYCLTYMPYK